MGQLIEVITASCASENVDRASSNLVDPGRRVQNQMGIKPEILSNICELLCFCVLHHPYRIKYVPDVHYVIYLLVCAADHVDCEQGPLFAVCRCNFLLNNVIDKILLLTQRREKYLVVGAVRFVRTILSRHVSLNICANNMYCYEFWGKCEMGCSGIWKTRMLLVLMVNRSPISN